MINASDDTLEQWTVAAMEKEGIQVNRRAKRGSIPFGEAALVHRGGGRYVALVCDSDVFHNVADAGPKPWTWRLLPVTHALLQWPSLRSRRQHHDQREMLSNQ